MAGYELTWVTDRLAAGPVPLSYEDLQAIRAQGVDAIMNLCAEYCDLHDIERESGFDVFYFPIEDDSAPALEEMEKALDWLDEALYLGKKVLVHCRLGLGRTGTFITAYLLRRGFGLKTARKRLERLKSTPTSFYQWRLLRRYGKQSGRLTLREPSMETKNLVDLGPFFADYEQVVRHGEAVFAGLEGVGRCGKDSDACCTRFLTLQLIEAAYLNYQLNKRLGREERVGAAARAVDTHKAFLEGPVGYRCPLTIDAVCVLYEYRPLACRLDGAPDAAGRGADRLNEELCRISKQLFFALNSSFLEDRSLLFPLTRVVSGKFVQDYFSFLSKF